MSTSTEPASTEPPTPGERASSAVDSDSLGPTDRVAPTWTEPLAQRLSRPFGGRLGRHAQVGRQWFWTPLRVILLFAVVVLAAAWLFKAPCQVTYDNGNGPQLDWRNNRQYTAMCYTDIIPRYGMGDLAPDTAFPYKTPWFENQGTPRQQVRYMEYPVLTGLFQWVNARAADGWATLASYGWLPGGLTSVLYFNITAFWLAAAWLVTIWALVLLCRRRIWDAALAAVSPLVFVHAFTNFDVLAAAFSTVGLLAWARRRPVLAGVLIGLGGAAKLYPLFFLGPLLVLAWRAGKLPDAMRAVLATAVTWLVVNVPILVLYPAGWREFFRLNNERPADPDSLYNVLMHFTGWAGFDGALPDGAMPTVLNSVSLALFLLACLAIGWLALAAPTRPRLASLCFLVVAAFLLTNKVWSPQYSLWLVPLAVLALPRWRVLLAWMIVDAAVWAPRMYYYLGTANKGLPEGWFLGAVVIRDAVVVALCVLVVREVLRPARDKVRTALEAQGDRDPGAVDDPCGGILDGARDRFVLPGVARWSRGDGPLWKLGARLLR
ncbi:glycosyltransferase 87 family protein [Saccharopolyspora sp. K220]|uniref:glycosyltransferase family 87 protein n=1 Tax=Saccharopolyspora soli TaxID=2926618 RepID=UPI001F5999D1|nr:glycosyltransferase 87 family protein [Saccharopolyspora soli]MCI2418955.1 glycosyltransferase 87 family protein [Saccharopolyspora soli]